MKSPINRYFYISITFLFIAVVAPTLFSDGMFMDGLIYAGISRNMANGIGTFWTPHLSFGFFDRFFDHPPLALGLQSIWFKVFGDSLFVERFYSLVSVIITGFFIVLIWKKVTKSAQTGWIPLLFWITSANVSWACANNMLENTMAGFVCLSAWLYLKSDQKYSLLWIVISGVSLSLALLSKGFVSLYIWTMPFFMWLIIRRDGFLRMCFHSILMIVSTIIPIMIIYLVSDEASHNMVAYFNHQVVGSIRNVATVSNRFAILREFLQQSILPIALTAVILIISYVRSKSVFRQNLTVNLKTVIFFLCLVLAGILPIMISLKQRGFYILTVFPFFAIILGLLSRTLLEEVTKRITGRIVIVIKIIALTLVAVAVIISVAQKGRIGRDKSKLTDCYRIINTVGENQSIHISKEISRDWTLHGYFARYGNISLLNGKENMSIYYLSGKTEAVISAYTKLELGLHDYCLYKKE